MISRIYHGYVGLLGPYIGSRARLGEKLDVPRDCKTFKSSASGCGCELLCLACVCFCRLKIRYVIRPNKSDKSNLPWMRQFTGPVYW